MTFGQRLKKARIEACLSQQALADAISQLEKGKMTGRTSIAQWESDIVKDVEAANLLKAARVLKVNPEWLRFGTGSMQAASAYLDGLSLASFNVTLIPLLDCEQIRGSMEQDNNVTRGHLGIDRELARVVSLQAFALKIKGESMLPVFKPGDIVIIDPAIQPLPGEIIAVELHHENAVVLRKYRPLKENSQSFELIPFNEDWLTITIDKHNPGRIIGTLVEHRCRRHL